MRPSRSVLPRMIIAPTNSANATKSGVGCARRRSAAPLSGFPRAGLTDDVGDLASLLGDPVSTDEHGLSSTTIRKGAGQT